KSCELFQFVHRRAECAGDMSGREGLSAACIQKDEVELSAFNGMQHGSAGFFSAKLVSEMLSISANLVFSESHVCLQLVNSKKSPGDLLVSPCRPPREVART